MALDIIVHIKKLSRLALPLVVMWIGVSCSSGSMCSKSVVPTGCPMQVSNVYANPNYPHECVTNVLLLPIDNPMEIEEFCLHHDAVMRSIINGFGKFHYFNVHYDPCLAEKVGRIVDINTWEVDRVKLGEIGQEYHSQAVMLVSIDDFRAYAPMRMKVKAVLVDANTGQRIWAFDEVYDTDDADVMNRMRLWWNSNVSGGDRRNRFNLTTVRPSLFFDFVFDTVARSYGGERIENSKAVRKVKVKDWADDDRLDQKRERSYDHSSCE